MIGERVSHYRIVDRLGAGGMGVVYVAEDLILHRMVAIKFASRGGSGGLESRLLEEARSASALDHPNIARIYDCGESEGRLFIVMERIVGRSVAEMLKDGPLPVPEALRIAAGILSGLDEAHRAGIVHRDIKPSNVMVTERGGVKVLDFGLAKRAILPFADAATHESEETVTTPRPIHLTAQGEVIGTPAYMSPEHVRGLPVDGRSDIFSLGSLLYACLTGHAPFRGQTSPEVMAQVIHVTPPVPSTKVDGAPPDLDRFVMKALEKEPGARYPTAEAMRQDLARLLDEISQTRELPTPPLRPPEPVTGPTATGPTGSGPVAGAPTPASPFRRRLLWGAGAVGATAAIAYFALPRSGAPSPQARRWYDLGVGALRDGTYFNAVSALDRAVAAEDGFALGHARLAEAWSELDSIERSQREMLLALRRPARDAALPPAEALAIEAIQASIARDFPAAIERYNQLLRQVPELERPRVWLDLGRVLEKANHLPRAVECYTEAARDTQYAAAFLRRGVLYGQQGKLDLAEKDFVQAQSIYEASRNLEGVAEVHFQRGRRLAIRRDLPAARTSLERSLKLAADYGSEFQQLRAQLQLSIVTYLEGHAASAQSIASEVVRKASAARLPFLTVRGLTDLGNAQLAKLDLPAAEATLREAVRLAVDDKLQRGQATARLSLGSVLLQQNRYPESEPELKAALDFFTRGQFDDETSLCQTLLARVYRSRGDFAQMHRILAEQLKAAETAGNAVKVIAVLGEMANGYSAQERYPEALQAFERRFALAKDRGVPADIGYSLSGQVSMLARLGRLEPARRLFEDLQTRPGVVDLMSRRLKVQAIELEFLGGAWTLAAAKAAQLLGEPGQTLDSELILRSLRARALMRAARPVEALREVQTLLERVAQSTDPDRVAAVQLAAAEVFAQAKNPARVRELLAPASAEFGKRQQFASWCRAEALHAEAAAQLGDTAAAQNARLAATEAFGKLSAMWGSENAARHASAPEFAPFRKYVKP